MIFRSNLAGPPNDYISVAVKMLLTQNFRIQAQDRAHRIGQTREVRVLRLICANTMEEDILDRTTYKKELGGAAIDGGMFNDNSTIEDRHEFLRKIFSRSPRGDGVALD